MSLKMKKVTRRTAAADEIGVKDANNLCPICWMPLITGEGPHAEKWKSVQITFKGKPAFSISRNSAFFGRPTMVFGINGISGIRKSNCDACHYVHYADFGTFKNVNGIWNVWEGMAPPTVSTACDQTVREPSKGADFYNVLFSKARGQTLVGGIFAKAFQQGATASDYFKSVNIYHSDKLPLISLIREMMLNQTFAGCGDCNQKMSQSSDVTNKIFEMLFFSDMDPKDSHGYNVEAMTHYIMLCGVLQPADYLEGGDKFNTTDADVKSTWTLRYITMWCCLQILLCTWRLSSIQPGVGHHVNYILIGTVDFYISLWFYAMNAINFTRGTSVDLKFSEFHFYYMSMLPFYLQKKGLNTEDFFNLSTLVLGEDLLSDWKSKDTLDDIQDHVASIYKKVIEFWYNIINNDMSPAILGLNPAWEGFIQGHFIAPGDLLTRRIALRSLQNPTIDVFVNFMGPFNYWLHFKHITMIRIMDLCDQYLGWINPMPAKVIWFNWCKIFNGRAEDLRVRFHIESKRLWIAKRLTQMN